MANMKVKTAVNKVVHQHDNSGVTITSMDFGKVNVSKILKVRQGDRLNIGYNMFCRLAPMAVPTYGRFMLRTNAFFVPTRVVWPSYDKWLERESDPSISASPLRISYTQLCNLFSNTSYGYGTLTNASATNYDFNIKTSTSAASRYILLTAKGRAFYSILRALGYVVVPIASGAGGSSAGASNTVWDSRYMDMRPLLSFLRCFYDWLYPSVYVQQQGFAKYFRYDSHDFTAFDLAGNSSNGWHGLLDLIFVAYDHDFYVDAWQNFNAPVHDEDSAIDVNAFAPDSARASVSTGSGGGSYNLDKTTFETDLDGSATSLRTLSAYGLRMLQSVADYWTRHNLVGSRFLERAATQYGFVSGPNRHNYSDFLKTWSSDVLMMDVTQTSASTSTSQLGEQAGKGIAKGDGSLKFEAKEDGYLIFISYLVPKIGYVQGLRPWCRVPESPFDEFTPELEDVGMTALPKSELFGQFHDGGVLFGLDSSSSSPYQFDGVFGFVPRYNEYKRGFDELNGDFIVPHLSSGGATDSYHTFRMFDEPTGTSGESIIFAANNAAFRQVGNQYDRVFSKNPLNEEGDWVADHFYVYFGWNITRYNTMKPMLATIPLFDKSGKEINASYLGEQLH